MKTALKPLAFTSNAALRAASESLEKKHGPQGRTGYPTDQSREFKSRVEQHAEGGQALQKEVKELNDNITAALGEIKEFSEKATAEIKSLGDADAETKKALEAGIKTVEELGLRLTDVEQKLARHKGTNDNAAPKSWGEQFAGSEEFKALVSRKSSKANVEVKVVTSLTTDVAGSAGDLLVPDRYPLVRPVLRPLRIRDLLMKGRTDKPSIQYPQETGYTNNAAPVAENTTKPESTLKFELITTNVVTIAHWLLASVQILDDVPYLQSYIDGRLRYGLDYVEEAQLLNGSGSGINLRGLKTAATLFDEALRTAGDTKIDLIRRGMLQVRIAEFAPSGIILHPEDWADIELTKDDNGNYIFANPQATTDPRLWGLPVVDTMAQTVDEFTIGAFNMAAEVVDRQLNTVEVSTEDSDNFRKNLVTIRAERREALAIYRPESIIDGPFTDPTP